MDSGGEKPVFPLRESTLCPFLFHEDNMLLQTIHSSTAPTHTEGGQLGWSGRMTLQQREGEETEETVAVAA